MEHRLALCSNQRRDALIGQLGALKNWLVQMQAQSTRNRWIFSQCISAAKNRQIAVPFPTNYTQRIALKFDLQHLFKGDILYHLTSRFENLPHMTSLVGVST